MENAVIQERIKVWKSRYPYKTLQIRKVPRPHHLNAVAQQISKYKLQKLNVSEFQENSGS